MNSKRMKLSLSAVFKLLVLPLLMVSCKSELEDCGAISMLLNPHKNQDILHLDFTKTKEELELQIRTTVRSADLKAPLKFGLELNGQIYNSSIHAPHINQFACYGMPAMRHKSPQLEVLMNKNHKLMIDGIHRLDLDSLAGFIGWYFPHDAPYGEKIVKLQCDKNCSSNKIEKCIETIADGYLNYYRKEASYKFQKSICLLDSKEVKLVAKKYPFELRLWLGDSPPVTIPPVIKQTSSAEIVL